MRGSNASVPIQKKTSDLLFSGKHVLTNGRLDQVACDDLCGCAFQNVAQLCLLLHRALHQSVPNPRNGSWLLMNSPAPPPSCHYYQAQMHLGQPWHGMDGAPATRIAVSCLVLTVHQASWSGDTLFCAHLLKRMDAEIGHPFLVSFHHHH
jgi:hypothetical protein